MPAPNFEQIQSFSRVTGQLKESAVDEFMGELVEGMSRDEVIELASQIADKYRMLGSELGAQWYDLCSELAGYSLAPAELETPDYEGVRSRASNAAARADAAGDYARSFSEWLTNEIMDSIRTTGDDNLWRDYRRGLVPGKWCRVPVGETCAWCMMLASQGAWYKSRESALRESAGRYHSDCDCIAVFHADADSISGYTQLQEYKSAYYSAENARQANNSGKQPYPEDLEIRVQKAKAHHAEQNRKRRENGEEEVPWRVYNETLVVMRYQNGLA